VSADLSDALEHLVRGIVDHPDEVRVDLVTTRRGRTLEVRVHPEDLGKVVKGGTRLGEVVDLYSYEVIEKIDAPFDGYLFFSRYSGMVGAGTQAFALAEAACSSISA